MPDASHRISLSTGIDMYYDRAGSGAPALIFLHGGGGWLEHWRGQIDRFARTTAVVACDLRGHGRTEAPSGRYDIPTFTDDVAALLDALRIERPVLVGHSLGGVIALRYAFDYPDRVSGIVVVDSGCRTVDPGRDGWRQLVVARVRDWDAAGEEMKRYDSHPESGRADLVAAALTATPPPPHQVIHATHYGLITHNNAAAASFIACPVLIAGASDMDYWPAIQSWTEYAPHARLVGIPRCGHYIMIEQPDALDAALTDFLADIQAGTAPSGEPCMTPSGWCNTQPTA